MPRSRRSPLLATALVFALLVGLPGILMPAPAAAQSGGVFYYQQITNISESVSGSVGEPVLSADGRMAVFAESPGSDDPATPNRIYRIASDGSGLAEVDSYTPKCYCGSSVDLSADGATVVSSDSVQIRVTTGGNGTTIFQLGSNEVSSVRLTAAGDRVFFILGKDEADVISGTALTRGIYAMGVDGSGLQLLIGANQMAALLGIPADQMGPLRGYQQALDISDDGSRLVFGWAFGSNHSVFTANGDGSGLVQVQRPVSFVQRVAISGNGASVAMDVIPVETQISEVSVVPVAGGPSSVLIPGLPTNQSDPISLTQDGGKLLIGTSGYLVDTATAAVTQLATPIEGLGAAHSAVIPDGLPRATMDATASQVLYAIHTTKCADCANLSEQLAVLNFTTPPPGAPSISNVTIDPTSVVLGDYEQTFAISAEVTTTDGELLAVGFSGIYPSGVIDYNFGSTTLLLPDESLRGAAAGNAVYSQEGIVYVERSVAEPGPRLIRVGAEVELADGRRVATAVDAGTFELTAPSA